MIKFTEALAEWHGPMFGDWLQNEVKKLDEDQLLLQQSLKYGSHATAKGMKLIFLSVKDDADFVYARTGIFYNSFIPGCQCDDDPSPMNVESEYCERKFTINKLTAETTIDAIE